MLRVTNKNISELLYSLGRASIILQSYHPKSDEVDIVIEAFFSKFNEMLNFGENNLSEDKLFCMEISAYYSQIVNNIADYLGLRAIIAGKDLFLIERRTLK